jgi:lysozyme family protein
VSDDAYFSTVALPFVLTREGGLVDDPADPGGLTNLGISQRAYPDLDIRALTPETVAPLYHRDYWIPAHCPDLPDGLSLAAFDCAVNQGVTTALRLLQATVGVDRDGVWGPVTATATDAAVSQYGVANILDDFCMRREIQYERTAQLKPALQQFLPGWKRRLEILRAAVLA